jgi:hypothetical protein
MGGNGAGAILLHQAVSIVMIHRQGAMVQGVLVHHQIRPFFSRSSHLWIPQGRRGPHSGQWLLRRSYPLAPAPHQDTGKEAPRRLQQQTADSMKAKRQDGLLFNAWKYVTRHR